MRSKYKCKDTEKLLKHIWNIKCHFESKKEFAIAEQFEQEYYTKYREYKEKQRELSDNYIFKGVS